MNMCKAFQLLLFTKTFSARCHIRITSKAKAGKDISNIIVFEKIGILKRHVVERENTLKGNGETKHKKKASLKKVRVIF